MEQKLLNSFVSPTSEYRGAPFWAWNGKLDKEELKEQIHEMHGAGLGGFFMHARVGLDTPYLEDEWFDCVRTCIDEAEKLNMDAWLYDEDRWPSGAAGGKVTKDPEFRNKRVVVEEITDLSCFEKVDATLAMFVAELDGHTIKSYQRIDSLPAKLDAGMVLVRFYIDIEPVSSWFNGFSYLDVLNYEAVDKFIEVTHESYKKEIANSFGNRVPGIFTDEPNYGGVGKPYLDNQWRSPWTQRLPQVFNERYGYDVIDHLLELFYDIEGLEISKARIDYIDCLAFLFTNGFSKKIGEWCGENGMMLTGHVNEEDTLSRQTNCTGACMRFYEHMQAPGMDLLTEYWKSYDTAKQVSSAARQFDRRWRLTETYGCTGWDFPFMGHKALGDWQIALGINKRCQHLAFYTMEGEAKRDYPASISYQSTWYEEFNKVEDYFGRINLAMDNGKEVRDILVLHPVESIWTMIRKDWEEDQEVLDYDQKLIDLRDTLLNASIDYDYGDEDIMSRHGSVVSDDGEAVLKIAEADYKCVVVPELITIRESTVKLLEKFKNAGGKVIFIGTPPSYVGGVKNDAAKELCKACESVKTFNEELVELLDAERRVSIQDADGNEIDQTLYLLREDENSSYFFMCNTKRSDSYDIALQNDPVVLGGEGAFSEVNLKLKKFKGSTLLELDPDTGEIYKADAVKNGDEWSVKTSLPQLGSRLFISTDSSVKYTERASMIDSYSQALPKKTAVEMMDYNVIPLDRAKYKIGDGPVNDEDYVLSIDKYVRDAIEEQHRSKYMIQPWTMKKEDSPRSVDITLEYEFYCNEIPEGPLYLGLENSELCSVSVNENKLDSSQSDGWWCDKSIKKLSVANGFIKLGKNIVTLSCSYDKNNSGLEAIYLLGDFGVSLDGFKITMEKPVKSLQIGDWGNQGLPFYSGATRYNYIIDEQKEDGERIFVKINDHKASCIRIGVNGEKAGVIAWAPYELDITDLLVDGDNELSIEVFASRRNSFGPLYSKEKWPMFTNFSCFYEFENKYSLVPCGLIEPAEIIKRTVVR